MKIINKKAFFWGVGITCALVFMIIFSGNIGSATKGPAIHNWPWFGQSLLLIPGILFIFNGVCPNSILGKIGGLIYSFLSW